MAETPSTFNLWCILTGGAGGTIFGYFISIFRNRLQKLRCHYVASTLLSGMPIAENEKYLNLHGKEFHLINKTNKDIPKLDVTFRFESCTTIARENVSYHKSVKTTKTSLSSVTYSIKNFNRGDTAEFSFDIANVAEDKFNISVDGLGIGLLIKDKRGSDKPPKPKIVSHREVG